MSDRNSLYLSAHELADLVECKVNQRSCMIAWLEANQWRFVIDKNGFPKVAWAFHDKKLGISETPQKMGKYAEAPNMQAFAAS